MIDSGRYSSQCPPSPDKVHDLPLDSSSAYVHVDIRLRSVLWCIDVAVFRKRLKLLLLGVFDEVYFVAEMMNLNYPSPVGLPENRGSIPDVRADLTHFDELWGLPTFLFSGSCGQSERVMELHLELSSIPLIRCSWYDSYLVQSASIS
jgi:hypothetical protein